MCWSICIQASFNAQASGDFFLFRDFSKIAKTTTTGFSGTVTWKKWRAKTAWDIYYTSLQLLYVAGEKPDSMQFPLIIAGVICLQISFHLQLAHRRVRACRLGIKLVMARASNHGKGGIQAGLSDSSTKRKKPPPPSLAGLSFWTVLLLKPRTLHKIMHI